MKMNLLMFYGVLPGWTLNNTHFGKTCVDKPESKAESPDLIATAGITLLLQLTMAHSTL